MTTYPAGTVAVATVRGIKDVRVLRNDVQWSSSLPINGYQSHTDDDVANVRPLVVIDPAQIPIGVEAAAEALRAEDTLTGDWLADQIEAQTKPPRMAEPGWGEKVTAHTERDPARRAFLRYYGGKLGWIDQHGTSQTWANLIDPEPAP